MDDPALPVAPTADVAAPDWGFLDTDGTFVAVPKVPLEQAGLAPPCEVQGFFGVRSIIEKPV